MAPCKSCCCADVSSCCQSEAESFSSSPPKSAACLSQPCTQTVLFLSSHHLDKSNYFYYFCKLLCLLGLFVNRQCTVHLIGSSKVSSSLYKRHTHTHTLGVRCIAAKEANWHLFSCQSILAPTGTSTGPPVPTPSPHGLSYCCKVTLGTHRPR